MSFKIPCGGFKLDEKLFSLDKNDVLSIPKPLTYDYMPEGYPKKGIGPVTLMEEQEVTFSNANSMFLATSPVKFDILDGQTYTVVWDGVEYSCVGHAMTEAGNYIGNPEALGGESTGEPFLYAPEQNYLWVSYNTSTSHTIKVTTQGTVYKTIDKNFLPEAEKFVVDATNLPSDTDFTGWGNLSESLRTAHNSGAEIFLDVYGDGKNLLKLTNAKGSVYLFIYPKALNTVSAYVLEALASDGGELKNYDIYTHTGTT